MRQWWHDRSVTAKILGTSSTFIVALVAGTFALRTQPTVLEAMVVVLSLIYLAACVQVSRSIAGPLAEVQQAAHGVSQKCIANLAAGMTALADGDLTVLAPFGTEPPSYRSLDEIGQTAQVMRSIIISVSEASRAYETARVEMQRLIGAIVRASNEVDVSATQFSGTTSQIGRSITRITDIVAEVTHGTTESGTEAANSVHLADLTAIVSQVSNNIAAQHIAISRAGDALSGVDADLSNVSSGAHAASSAAERTTSTAKEGNKAIEQTLRSFEDVCLTVQQNVQTVEALGQHSTEIGAIVAAIDDIAAQTNLLALNAAIEAARAGEHGKGFAVVADEVRKLAQRVTDETTRVGTRIGAIQEQISGLVRAMQASSAQVKNSLALGKLADSVFAELISAAVQAADQATTIAATVEQTVESLKIVRVAAHEIETIAAQTNQDAAQMQTITSAVERRVCEAGEISASALQQNGAVRTMTERATRLAQLSTELRQSVESFAVEDWVYISEGDSRPQVLSAIAS